MGKAVKSLAMIAVAVFAPYAAAALGLSGFAATAFSFVLQAAASSVLGPKPGGGGAGVTDSGFLLNKGSNVAAIPVVYGDRRMGGVRAYVNTSDGDGNVSDDNDTEYLHVVLAVAQGASGTSANAIDDITAIQFNNTEAWSGSVKGQSGSITSEFSGKLTLRMWLGAHNQTSANDNVSGTSFTVGSFNKSVEWTSNHNMKGIAYIYAIMQYDRDVFPGAPTITVDVKGKKVKAVSEGGTGVHPTTYVNTDAERKNPANIIYDYLTDPVYGKGISTSDINIESFKTARTWANTLLTATISGVRQTNVTFNGALDTADTLFNNTQKLLTCANMNLVYANGEYQLKPVKEESFTSAFDFNKDNMLGKITTSLGSKKSRFNRMKVNFFNPDLDFQADSLIVENSTYLTEDGGVVNEKSVDLPMVSSTTDANDLATRIGTYYLDLSRHQTIMQFKASHEALKLNVGDPVTVTHETYNFTAEKFRVNSITLFPDATVDVILEQYAPDATYLEKD